ncbi:hypothetical protein CPC08DRAFT_225360 [Agrocybe pediades]|nr:hypothetical protein CPC08DRAFT_225360 [Agrocybe pediades]
MCYFLRRFNSLCLVLFFQHACNVSRRTLDICAGNVNRIKHWYDQRSTSPLFALHHLPGFYLTVIPNGPALLLPHVSSIGHLSSV